MNNYGPNAIKLLKRFIARAAIPKGGGVADAVAFFQNTELRKKILKDAETTMAEAIQAVKNAPDNPYGDDDEVIAGAILEKIAETERQQRMQHMKRDGNV